jgi:hypothetical protein
LLVTGCGDPVEPADDAKNKLSIEPFAAPEIQYDALRGTTTVVVQFVARNSRHVPLAEGDLDVTLRINRQPIDVEGLLQQDSATLAANLHVTLVLDTSYSMLTHSVPAFEPMLASAKRTLGAGSALYADRPGVFVWDLVWFDDVIYRPLQSTASLRWKMSDVERIPTPAPGSFTKLYAAVSNAIESSAAHAAEFGTGPRDQHLVVAFSDGADNYSWFDNAETGGQLTLGTDRQYRFFGAAPVTREDVQRQLGDHPEVQMHVIGLSSAVNDDELRSLSRAGHGAYFKDLDASKVDALFDQVIQEFTSVQSHGATVPLPPGEYEFEVIVRAGKASGSYRFDFMGGAQGAKLLR